MASTMSSPQALQRFGWIGLGSMGNAMAKNIHTYLKSQHGASVLFYNRTASRGDALEALGGQRCGSIAELTGQSNIIFISASDDAAVETIIEQIIASGFEISGKTIVDTTTIHPNTTKAIDEKLVQHGVNFAAMPVFGATPIAEQGKLLAAYAGSKDVYDAIAPVLKGVIAREVLLVGEQPEKATLLKTAGQVIARTRK